MGSVKIKWTDPPDISTNEPVPCTWAGTVVVRKEGSAPRHRWDGTLIVESTTRDEYSVTAFEDDTIEGGKTYYYGIFPYHVALDDANNPIKHYRFTKVMSVSTGVVPVPPEPPEWNSGTPIPWAESGYAWEDASAQQHYLEFLATYSPVLYSNAHGEYQAVAGNDDYEYPNALFILNHGTGYYSDYKYGYYSNGSLTLVTNETFKTIYSNTYRSKLYYSSVDTKSYKNSLQSTSTAINDIYDFIDTVFANNSPLMSTYSSGGYTLDYNGGYPYIKYVYLVDDLDTLSNPVPVYPQVANS